MAENAKAKADRLHKRRENRQKDRERTGDSPEAAAEHGEAAKQSKQYDRGALQKLRDLGARTGIFG
jgi:hypothetical protein